MSIVMQGNENALEIVATVKDVFRQTGRLDEFQEVKARMLSGDYDNVKAVAQEVTYGLIEFEEGS